MGTVIRSTISKRNEYYISKHRYYELKHYCLQYNDWKREIALRRSTINSTGLLDIQGKIYQSSDKVGNTAVICASMEQSIKGIEQCAIEAGGDIAKWIFTAVTQDKSYAVLISQGIPCSKQYFYLRYRKFFWLLDKIR